jgi:hypothetical protein
VRALGLAEAVGPRPREAGGRDDDDRRIAVEHGELPPLGHPDLVDVAGEDDVGAGVREPGQYASPPGERPLPRAPGRVGELVMQADDAQSPRRRRTQASFGAPHRRIRETAGLMPPWPNGVDADDEQLVR